MDFLFDPHFDPDSPDTASKKKPSQETVLPNLMTGFDPWGPGSMSEEPMDDAPGFDDGSWAAPEGADIPESNAWAAGAPDGGPAPSFSEEPLSEAPGSWGAQPHADRSLAQAGAPAHIAPSAQSLLEGLNEHQHAAVVHQGAPLLIVAGAGSGKTRVLTHRIAYLLATHRAHPGEILAITFTNKAAAEMRERVKDLVGPAADRMWISTFHSSCVKILRREAGAIGLNSNFSIYDSQDSLRLITLIAKGLDLDAKKFPAKQIQNRISGLKNELIDDEDFASTANMSDPMEAAVVQVFREYTQRLRQANALDFDDLIAQVVYMFRAFPALAENYRRRFRHILVDEYQDTNHAQYALVKELAQSDSMSGAELTVVGDSDQSIYAFRGADIRNIIEFEKDYPQARTILLEQNYRSTQTILSAANAVISRNPDRPAKNLWTAEGDGEKIVGYAGESEYDEAQFIAKEIDRLTDEKLALPGQMAIFYRTNAQSRNIEDVLIRFGLPYRVVGGTRFYERKEIKDVLAYLRVLVNPDDDVNLRRILNEPKRGIGDRAEAAVASLAQRERISFMEALKRSEEAPGLGTRGVKLTQQFAALMAEMKAAAEAGSPVDAVETVLERTGYLATLQASSDPQDESRVENLAELVAVIREFASENPEGTLGEYLEQVALVADADQLPDAPEGSAAEVAAAVEEAKRQGVITLMTLHTAKGLEFPVVFLTGLEQGIFPHRRSATDPKELAEERRLAYVGLTRARQRLYVTRSEVRSMWGQSQYNPASQFLDEIPAELIDWKREGSRLGFASSFSNGFGGSGFGSSGLGNAGLGTGWGSGSAGSGARYTNRFGDSPAPSLPKGPGVGGPTSFPGRPDKPAASGAPSSSEAVPMDLSVGDTVNHSKFGRGTVTALEGSGPKAVAKVRFADSEKRLLLRYAPLVKE